VANFDGLLWRKHKCKKPKHQPGFVNSAIFLTQFLQMCMLLGKTYATKSYLPHAMPSLFWATHLQNSPQQPLQHLHRIPNGFCLQSWYSND
jgi:hypothetical protein